jgi:hypothetical protein
MDCRALFFFRGMIMSNYHRLWFGYCGVWLVAPLVWNGMLRVYSILFFGMR